MVKAENILLLGLGGIGEYLARRLSSDGHHITAIEADRRVVAKADSTLDARLLVGSATDFDLWREAQAETMDYVIAVTDDDSVNILAAAIADKVGIPRKIVRSRAIEVWRPDAIVTTKHFGIDLVIRPAELAATEIARLLKMRAGTDMVDVGTGAIQVLATHVDARSSLSGKTVIEVAEAYSDVVFRVGCVTRGIDTVIPTASFKIEPDDHVYIVAGAGDMPQIMTHMGIRQSERHHVLIVGGGLVGFRVAELMQGTHRVTLMEKGADRAEELSHLLGKTRCLNGDGSDGENLAQAGLLKMDTVVAATGSDETNVMASVLAKHLIHTQGLDDDVDPKAIAVLKRSEYRALASAMGTDIAVHQKELAADAVIRYIRRGRVLSVAHLHGCDAEVVELVAERDAPITKAPLKEQRSLQGEITIGAVMQDDTWGVAVGDTHIQGGDRAVCVCREATLGELQRLFLS